MREFGEIIKFDFLRRIGLLKNERKRWTIFVPDSVRPDRNHSRAWSFIPSGSEPMPVTFVCVPPHKASYEFGADDIAPLFDLGEELVEQPEQLVVTKKIQTYGWAEREDGDEIFFHQSDCMPEFEDRWRFLREGAPLFGKIEMDGKNPRARYLELYGENELAEFDREEANINASA